MTDDLRSSPAEGSGRSPHGDGRAPAGLFRARRSRAQAGRSTMPSGVLEVLRLLVVVFFAGAGFQLGSAVGDDRPVLGALNGTALGLVLGSGIGYVLGGVLGRSTAAGADEVSARLRAVSADQLLAGSFGTVAGVLVGAGVAWPAFFLRPAYLAFPLFGFVVVVLGYLGFQLGMSKREGVLGLVGGAARPVAAAALPRVLDTSVAVDGRVLDIVRAGFLHGEVLVPTPVLAELQGLADAGDDLRRAKGRRGLELLEALRREPGVELRVLDLDVPGVHEVDAKLVRICLDRGAALLTLDTGLARAASLAGVQVLNLHALALALRPPVAAGDHVPVLLLKAGKEPGQAVGYLDDGSMVVVEQARDRVGAEVLVRVTSVLTTANGRLVFGRPADEPAAPAPAPAPDPAPAPAPAPVGVLLPAAGRGERLGPGAPKALRDLAGEPLLVHAVRGLRAAPSVGPVVVAAPPAEVDAVALLLAPFDVVVVAGGAERQQSVARALAALPPEVELVLVHDAARALTPVAVVEAVVAALRAGAPAVVPVLPVADTVKQVDGDRVLRTVERASLRAVQTPQGFRRDVLARAHDEVAHAVTDDAGMVEALGLPVLTVPGAEEAFKVTRPLDLLLAEALLRGRGD